LRRAGWDFGSTQFESCPGGTAGTDGMSLTAGFIGLGNMGGALAANLVGAGLTVITHDAVGRERTPDGATNASSPAEVAQQAEVIVLSLPDGKVSELVVRDILSASDRRTTHIIDTSTVGVGASQTIAALLAEDGIGYIDAPVSGGVAGAQARTLTVMVAGPDDACAAAEPVLAGLSDRRIRVGNKAGLAQALKLANNFLSATALAATSEAVAFGQSVGLDMAKMLEVLDISSGQSAAISDKFLNHVVTEKYSSGFLNSLMAKDVNLYLQAVTETGGPAAIGGTTAGIWQQFADTEPGVDFTRIYPYVRDH
jgi:3-hydroxyisobutyrate dehydrogenase